MANSLGAESFANLRGTKNNSSNFIKIFFIIRHNITKLLKLIIARPGFYFYLIYLLSFITTTTTTTKTTITTTPTTTSTSTTKTTTTKENA